MSLSSVVAECEAAVAELQRPAAIRVCAWQDAADFRFSYGSPRHISPYGLALLTLPEACPLSSPLTVVLEQNTVGSLRRQPGGRSTRHLHNVIYRHDEGYAQAAPEQLEQPV